MQHGRGHDERRFHARHPRANNVPEESWEERLEAEMSVTGKHHAAPAEGLVGAHRVRAVHTSGAAEGETGEHAEPTGPGAAVAPTRQAAERERERHRLERALGRVPAGEAGRLRDRRGATATRERLDEAARAADRAVAGRDLRRK